MEQRLLLSLIGFMFTAGLSHASDIYFVEQGTQNEVTVGEEQVQILCKVDGVGYDALRTPVIIYKSQNGGEEIEVSQATSVKIPFKQTGRYKIDILDAENKEFSLSIDNVKVADAGNYKCAIGNADVESVVHSLVVFAEVEDVRLDTDAEITQDAEGHDEYTFHLDDHDPKTISCVVIGGHPKPQVTIHQNDTDLTPDFKYDLVEIQADGSQKGLEETKYQITLENNNYQPLEEYDGQKLKCSAKVPKSPIKRMTARATISVKYPPTFKCKESLAAKVGHEDLQITCEIHANPSVDAASISWSWEDDTENVTIREGEQVDTYHTSAKEMGGHIVARLHIRVVNDTDFRSYTLSARNDIKRAERKIMLVEAGTEQVREISDKEKNSGAAVTDPNNAAVTSLNLLALIGSLLLVIGS